MLIILGLLLLFGLVGIALVRAELDVVTLLTLFVAALFAINARWVLPGTGAVGTPAMVAAAGAAWWWWVSRINPGLRTDHDPNPIRVALLAYLWIIGLSWGLSRLRPLSELEVNGSNRALIIALGLTGVALLVSDGVTTRTRLDTLLRRLVIAGVVFAAVGYLQFFAGIDLVASLAFPGLVPNGEVNQALAVRADFSRAEGTGLHSIEFGVVLAVILPLAIHFSLNANDRKERRRFALMTLVIGAAIPLSISRTAVIAVAVALLVASLAWNWRRRIVGAISAGFLAVVAGIAAPGLIGTFRALFFASSSDPSITARINRVPLVLDEVSKSPWLGSGIGTFSADEDFLLDNQYFETLIETGVVGLLAVLLLIGTAMTLCYLTFVNARDDDTRYLATAILAGLAVLPIVMAFFDAFFYRILMGITFILTGSAGGLWRLVVRNNSRSSLLPVTGGSD